MIEVLSFTGKAIVGLGLTIPASCIVRNEVNGWRLTSEVLYEQDGHVRPTGTPYQPRPFPCGRWLITEVIDKLPTSVYSPVFIATNAWQWLEYWQLDKDGCYDHPTGARFRARGYGAHYSRVRSGGELVRSNTTLGCINTDTPDDAVALGDVIRRVMGARERVYLDVPPWPSWEI